MLPPGGSMAAALQKAWIIFFTHSYSAFRSALAPLDDRQHLGHAGDFDARATLLGTARRLECVEHLPAGVGHIFGLALLEQLAQTASCSIYAIEIEVEESFGQSAIYREVLGGSTRYSGEQ